MTQEQVDAIIAIAKAIAIFATMNSVVSAGILKTIKDTTPSFRNSKNKNTISMVIVYILGVIFGFFLSGDVHAVQKIVYGICIGAVSVYIYASVLKSVSEVIPKLTSKIFGS